MGGCGIAILVLVDEAAATAEGCSVKRMRGHEIQKETTTSPAWRYHTFPQTYSGDVPAGPSIFNQVGRLPRIAMAGVSAMQQLAALETQTNGRCRERPICVGLHADRRGSFAGRR